MKTVHSPEGWSIINEKLERNFRFVSFQDAMIFVNAVAALADQHNHHPDITINYCKVSLSLTTHDAGALTDKDFTLAAYINDLPV